MRQSGANFLGGACCRDAVLQGKARRAAAAFVPNGGDVHAEWRQNLRRMTTAFELNGGSIYAGQRRCLRRMESALWSLSCRFYGG